MPVARRCGAACRRLVGAQRVIAWQRVVAEGPFGHPVFGFRSAAPVGVDLEPDSSAVGIALDAFDDLREGIEINPVDIVCLDRTHGRSSFIGPV